MYLSELPVDFEITRENSEEYKELLHPQGVYDFISKTIMTCITYAPPNVTVAGFGNRVSKSTGVIEVYIIHALFWQMKIKLRSDSMQFWIIYFHNKDAVLPGFGRLFGSTFEAVPVTEGK